MLEIREATFAHCLFCARLDSATRRLESPHCSSFHANPAILEQDRSQGRPLAHDTPHILPLNADYSLFPF
jgi:hypothetical protein